MSSTLASALLSEARRHDSPIFNYVSLEYSSILSYQLSLCVEKFKDLENQHAALVSVPALIRKSSRGSRIDKEPIYSTRIRRFIEEYTAGRNGINPFGGREKLLETLDTWLVSNNQLPRLLITSKAGSGKSALLVHWHLRHIDSQKWNILFVPISIREEIRSTYKILRILYERLTPLSPMPLSIGPAADTLDYESEVSSILENLPKFNKYLVLVFDGLDESEDPNFLKSILPSITEESSRHLKVIVSARLTTSAPSPEHWLDVLNWKSPRHGTPTLAVHALTLDEVAEVLSNSGLPNSYLNKKKALEKKNL